LCSNFSGANLAEGPGGNYASLSGKVFFKFLICLYNFFSIRDPDFSRAKLEKSIMLCFCYPIKLHYYYYYYYLIFLGHVLVCAPLQKFLDSLLIFSLLSSIEGEYVLKEGDRVQFRTCPLPPKLTELQAVEVTIIEYHGQHEKWWSGH